MATLYAETLSTALEPGGIVNAYFSAGHATKVRLTSEGLGAGADAL
jgi:hypothetical protein